MRRRIVLLLVLFTVVAVSAIVAQKHLSLDELILHETSLRAQIANVPMMGVLIGFAIYTIVCFVPGTTGKSLIVGWLFGVWKGTLVVNCGLTVAAIATFLASRYLLRDVVEARFGYHLQRIDNAVQRDGGCYLFMLRVIHCPYSVTNYMCGATSMRLRSFWWASQLGMLPGNIVFVYAGAQLPSLQQLADEGAAGVISWQLFAALIVLSVLPICARYLAGRWRASRVSRHA